MQILNVRYQLSLARGMTEKIDEKWKQTKKNKKEAADRETLEYQSLKV